MLILRAFFALGEAPGVLRGYTITSRLREAVLAVDGGRSMALDTAPRANGGRYARLVRIHTDLLLAVAQGGQQYFGPKTIRPLREFRR